VRLTAHPAIQSQSGRRALLAAFLSFLFPGLGQAYNRQPGLAWVLAAPVLLLVATILLVLAVGTSQLFARLFDIRFLIGLIVLDAVMLAWRLVAIVQAHLHRAGRGWRGAASWATAVLVVLTLAMHALPAYYAAKGIDTINTVAWGGTRGAHQQNPFPNFSRSPIHPPSPTFRAESASTSCSSAWIPCPAGRRS